MTLFYIIRQELRMNDTTNFNEDEDIILPNSILGEIIYLKFIITDMIMHPKGFKKKYKLLKRQIRFFRLWMKNK